MTIEVEAHKFCDGCPYLEIETTGEFMTMCGIPGKPRYTCVHYNLCKRLMEWMEAQMEN